MHVLRQKLSLVLTADDDSAMGIYFLLLEGVIMRISTYAGMDLGEKQRTDAPVQAAATS